MEKFINPAENFDLRQMGSFASKGTNLYYPSFIEWSDGRIEGFEKTKSVVQKSHETGKYMWLADYMAQGDALGVKNKPKPYGFHDLQEAYNQFKYIGELEDERCVELLWEIVRAFNDTYRRSKSPQKKIAPVDSRFYIRCILELLEKGGDRISLIEKMELYREAGMFSNCYKIYESKPRWADRERVEELLLRAANGDSSPYRV